jgi:hypothetical protein
VISSLKEYQEHMLRASRFGEKVDLLRTVIDGGVHVFKGTLESDVFDS